MPTTVTNEIKNDEALKKLVKVSENEHVSFGECAYSVLTTMSGKNATDNIISIVNKANLSSELSSESTKKSKGFVVSVQDLENIISYVNLALNLPSTTEKIETYMGYKEDNAFITNAIKDNPKYKDLLPSEHLKLYEKIVEHAKLWDPLEYNIKILGNELNSYSKAFYNSVDDILDTFEDFSRYMTIEEFKLDEEGKRIYNCILESLETFKNTSVYYQNTASTVNNRLSDFRQTLSNELIPSIKKFEDLYRDCGLCDLKEDLDSEIKDLNNNIDALQKQYDHTVGLAFTGASGMIIPPIGVVTWLITGGVYGDKAEKIRKKKNNLIKERNDKINQSKAYNAFFSGIQKLKSSMSSFESSMNTAYIGVQNLSVVFSSVVKDIELAVKHLKNTTDPEFVKRLKQLRFEFEMAKTMWSDCGNITEQLVKDFKTARNNIKKKYSNSKVS